MQPKDGNEEITADFRPRLKNHWFAKMTHVILKNYKMVIRSRTSALIFFFGPLFIIFMVCMGFNTSSLHNINVAVFSEAYSPLAEDLITNLSGGDYNILRLGSEAECIESIKINGNHICAIFPKNMVLDNSANNNIQIYVDDSRINIANMLIDKLASKVSTQSKQISIGVVSQMLGALDDINKEVEVGKVGVSGLVSSNKDEQTKIQTALEAIDQFDFTVIAIDTSTIDTAISEIKDDYNLSSSAFSSLESAIGVLKTEYASRGTKLNAAKEKASTVQEKAQAVKSSLIADPAKIGAVEGSFTKIRGNVDAVKVTNVESIVSPLKTTVRPIAKNRSYLVYVLPPLLTLLVMLVSLLMSSTSIIREKQSSAYFRNFVTPTNDITFMMGQYLTDISILAVEIIIMLGVSSIFVSGVSLKMYALSGLILLIIASIFIFLGITLGYLFNTSESVTVGAMIFGIVTLVFSNTLLPSEALSGFLRTIVKFNPYVIGEGIVKQLLVFESISMQYLYWMLIYVAAFAIVALLVHKLKEHVISN